MRHTHGFCPDQHLGRQRQPHRDDQQLREHAARDLNDSNGNTLYTFTGSGERTIIGNAAVSNPGSLTATLEYSPNGGLTWNASLTQARGPYGIGSSGFYPIVGENGDDADYNDVVLQFSWKN